MQPTEVIDIKSPAGNGVYITYQTIVLPRVEGCGHRLDLHRLPRHRNCNFCWMTWLNSNGEAVQTAEELLASKDDDALAQITNKKFIKKLKQFLSTVANFVENECTTLKT